MTGTALSNTSGGQDDRECSLKKKVRFSPRDERLEKIEHAHRDDGELLFRLAELRESDRDPESAAQLVDQAIQHGFERPEAFLKRLRFRAESEDIGGATEDARRVLESEHVSPPMVREVIGRLVQLGEREPLRFVESNAVATLDVNGKLWLAATFNRSCDHLSIAVKLLEPITALRELQSDLRERAINNLGSSYMGLGRCKEARSTLRWHELQCRRDANC